MAEPAIDPRYAAQFQRGYDPAVHTPVREHRGPAPIQGPAPAVVRRVPDPPPAGVRSVEVPSAEPAPADAEVEPVPPGRPRVEWVLLGAGPVLLVIAGALFAKQVEFQTMYSGVGPGFEEQLLSMAAGTLPGPLLVAGIVAFCAWAVLQAVRPRP
jgi:hypothetical protein